jgi:hypothetical protein
VTGAAQTGSAAAGTEDHWSDVDLFFGLADAAPADVLKDFSACPEFHRTGPAVAGRVLDQRHP